MSDAIDAVLRRFSAPQHQAWQRIGRGLRLLRMLCGRQAGKTWWILVWLLVGAMTVPGSVNVYLALTKESAKTIVWKELVATGLELGLDESCFKEHGATVRLPNGSVILVTGTDDRKTIENWRGTKLNKVVIDEMGVQPPEFVAYLVREILWPAIMKHNGAIVLAGTPGLVPEGYWWDLTRPEVEHEPGFLHWTALDNPGIPHAEEFLADTLREFKWTTKTPAFVREFLGRWVADPDALVYPYRVELNAIGELPKRNEHGTPVTWRYVLGQHIGTLDTIAWVLLAWAPQWPGVIVTLTQLEQLDPYAAAEQTRALLARHPGCDYVLDPGELGSAHAEAHRQRHHLGGIVADRHAQPAAIRDVRGALQAGRLRVLEGEACELLRAQWRGIGWDARRRLHDGRSRDSLALATIHGYRRVPPHSRNLAPAAPVLSPREQFLHDVERNLIRRARTRQEQGRRRVLR